MASYTKRGNRWRAQIRKAGQPTVSKTFPNKTQAQRWARQVESDMDRQSWGDPSLLAERSLQWLIEQYQGSREARPQMATSCRLFQADLGDVTLANLNALMITKWARLRASRDGVTPATLQIDLINLGSLLKFAHAYLGLLDRTGEVARARVLLKDEGLVAKSRERDRRPAEEELARLQGYLTSGAYTRTARTPLWALIQFSIASAMRLGETCRIEWRDLNQADRTVVIRNRKHPSRKAGNNQEVPLLGDAFDLVMEQPRTGSRIWPYNPKSVSSTFPRICHRLGIVDLHWHDFRHEAITRLFEQGYQIQEVALVSGHRDWGMLRRYVQLRAKDLHRC